MNRARILIVWAHLQTDRQENIKLQSSLNYQIHIISYGKHSTDSVGLSKLKQNNTKTSNYSRHVCDYINLNKTRSNNVKHFLLEVDSSQQK